MISGAKTAMAPAADVVGSAWATAENFADAAKAAVASIATNAAAKASASAICVMEIKPSDATAAREINIILNGSDDLFKNHQRRMMQFIHIV
jgi:hypothetical protein